MGLHDSCLGQAFCEVGVFFSDTSKYTLHCCWRVCPGSLGRVPVCDLLRCACLCPVQPHCVGELQCNILLSFLGSLSSYLHLKPSRMHCWVSSCCSVLDAGSPRAGGTSLRRQWRTCPPSWSPPLSRRCLASRRTSLMCAAARPSDQAGTHQFETQYSGFAEPHFGFAEPHLHPLNARHSPCSVLHCRMQAVTLCATRS